MRSLCWVFAALFLVSAVSALKFKGLSSSALQTEGVWRCGSTQVQANEGLTATLSCPTGLITDVLFASYGTPTGSCGGPLAYSKCHASSTMAVVKKLCVGKPSCAVYSHNSVFGDPCFGTPKRGLYVIQCDQPTTEVCGSVPIHYNEGYLLSLTCPFGVVTDVTFSSYGTPNGDCNTPVQPTANPVCNAAGSTDVVKNLCMGKPVCTFTVGNALFKDPCPGTPKRGIFKVMCTDQPAVPIFPGYPVIPPLPVPVPPPKLNPPTCSVVPENGAAILTCPPGLLINRVLFASYGTPKGDCSNSNTLGVNTQCDAALSVDIVNQMCLGKMSCNVGANNGVFGDPCFGTVKKLAISVQCGNPVVCSSAPEGQSVTLSCPAPSTINQILWASYGTPGGSCSGAPAAITPTCHSSNSLSAVSSACLGKGTCTFVAGNSFFADDPCYGTVKRGIFYAQCGFPAPLPLMPLPSPPLPLVTSVCGSTTIRVNENLNATLTCPLGAFINQVQFSAYGLPTGTCPPNNPITDLTFLSTFRPGTCDAARSIDKVTAQCVGHPSCSVKADNSVFGDPCYGTPKRGLFVVQCTTHTTKICALVPPVINEGQTITLTCPSGGYIVRADFASYGTPVGDCSSHYVNPACHSPNSMSYLASKCLTNPPSQSCSFIINNANLLGDPCYGVPKRGIFVVECSTTSSSTPAPAPLPPTLPPPRPTPPPPPPTKP